MNFGLTGSGFAMWTSHWCYGTFLLCLKLKNGKNAHDTSRKDTKTTDTTSQIFSSEITRPTVEQSTQKIVDEQNESPAFDGNHNDSKPENERGKTTANLLSETTLAVKNNTTYIFLDGLYVQTPSNTKGSEFSPQSTAPTVLDENKILLKKGPNIVQKSDASSKFKVWWVLIGFGSLLLLFLIVTIVILIIRGKGSFKGETRRNIRPAKRYFRRPLCSTSVLMASESDEYTNVYDFIPSDCSSLPDPSCMQKTRSQRNGVVQSLKNRFHSAGNTDRNSDPHLYQDVGSRKEKNGKSGDKKECDSEDMTVTESSKVRDRDAENIYEEFVDVTLKRAGNKGKAEQKTFRIVDSEETDEDSKNHDYFILERNYFVLEPTAPVEAQPADLDRPGSQHQAEPHTYDHLMYISGDGPMYDRISFTKRHSSDENII